MADVAGLAPPDLPVRSCEKLMPMFASNFIAMSNLASSSKTGIIWGRIYASHWLQLAIKSSLWLLRQGAGWSLRGLERT